MATTREAALERLRPWVERARRFEGWSFGELGARSLGPPQPWDYAEVVAEHARGAASVLDLGTGGGEVLAAMRPSLPARVVATEEWHVNAPVARRRLRPLGVEVIRARNDRGEIPCRDGSFDLVIDRHEAFDPADVARILRPEGWFVTQQVAAAQWAELRRRLPMTDWSHVRPAMLDGLRAAGFEIARDEVHTERVAYPSLGEVVYLLAVSSAWELPGFGLERYLDALLAVEADCSTGDGLVLTEGHYLIVARRP